MKPSRATLLSLGFLTMSLPTAPPANAAGEAAEAASESAPSLREQLDQRKANFEKVAGEDKIQSYQEGIDAVRHSGILEKATNEGDAAPDFTLKNAIGEEVTLSDLLKNGPVVLTWYRGGWCPYCNLTLAALQRHLPEIEAAGAQLVALTPELPDKSLDTKQKGELSFQVLTDLNNEIARKYGLVFELTEFVEEAMRKFANLKSYNGDDYAENELPLSATYVINTDGTIHWAFLDPEYRHRAEPESIVAALERLNDPEVGKTPEAVVRRFWSEVWNPPYRYDLFDELVAEDFSIHSSGKTVSGREDFLNWVKGFHGQVRNVRLKIDDLFTSADGTKITTRWTCSGTNGGMFGSEADGRPVKFTGITVTEAIDGKMQGKWVERSALELFQSTFSEDSPKKTGDTVKDADAFGR